MSESILEEAQKLVYGERAKSYGSAAESYKRIAGMFSALTGKQITAAEAAMFMILVKLDREQHKAGRDNRVDGAGYFAVLDMIRQDEEVAEALARQEKVALLSGFAVNPATAKLCAEKLLDELRPPAHPPAGPKNPPKPENDHPRG